MGKKMWRCKFCNHRQEFQNSVCENCGQDLTMGMGEIYFEGQADGPGNNKPPKSKKRWILIAAVVALAAALAVSGVLFWMNSGTDLPEDSAPTTINATEKPTTEPTTQPVTESTTVPTTEPDDNTMVMAPDVKAFIADFGGLPNAGSNDDYAWGYCVMESEEAACEIFMEYRDLLTESYPYKQVGAYLLKPNGAVIEGYCYEYTGKAQLDPFRCQPDGAYTTVECNFIIQLNKRAGGDELLIQWFFSKQIQFEDRGVRTTYEPNGATVTKVKLNCMDLLYDPYEGTVVNWVAEGDEISYDIGISYTGTQTRPFFTRVISSNPSVLEVDEETCQIKALKPGTATITVTAGGMKDSVELTVYPLHRDYGCELKTEMGKFETNSNGEKELSITVTLCNKSKDLRLGFRYLLRESFRVLGHTPWEKDDEGFYFTTVTFAYDPSVQDPGDCLFFYLLKVNDDGSFDLRTDLLDFRVWSF